MRIRHLAIAVAGAALLASCGAPGGSSTASSGSPTPVSIALSWTPNTDYTGVYVAQAQGLYAQQGIELTVLPYASTAPETLVASGKADFGFSYQAGVAYARAGGQDVVAVFAPDQKGTYAIGVDASRTDIRSPKDLDGKVYAGFGTPDEGPLLRTVIRNAGGRGDFTTVTLNTSAYDAVTSGKVDFTIPVATWEAVQAKYAGKPMKLFALTDYGFPDQYSVLIASSTKYLTANPDVARRFLAATAAGYALAARDPKAGAQALIDQNPGTFQDTRPVFESQRLLADGGYLVDAQGAVGRQDPARWQAYGGFLVRNRLLADASGTPLATAPDWSAYFTNDYLP